ncbi:MAG: hypothetical protein AAGA66_11015 [Bacteroidota bacterium]
MESAESTIDVVSMITYLLFIYLILAIFIERCVELFIGVLNYVDQKMGWYGYWNKKAEKNQKRLDELYKYQGEKTQSTDKMFTWILWEMVTEKLYTGGKDIISAFDIRFKFFRNVSRVFAFIVALFFSYFIQNELQVDLITLFENISGARMVSIGVNMKVILTAVLLSVGSEPLHEIITKVETIGKDKNKK